MNTLILFGQVATYIAEVQITTTTIEILDSNCGYR